MKSPAENNEQTLTKEQCHFYILIKELKRLENLENKTFVEFEKIDKIKLTLWSIVQNYAKGEMNKMLSYFNSSNEEKSDVMQDMATIFYTQLPRYNPLQTAPITFFAPYFRQVISQSIRSNHKRLTQYDANNVRKIKKIISEYEQQGIDWTVDMIVNRTELSTKVVKASLHYANVANSVNIDDMEYLKSNILTPEEAFDENERKKAIFQAIQRNATPEEADLLYRRINPDGHKEKPYEQLAKEVEMPLRKVKAVLNELICKLNQDEELRNFYGMRNKYDSFTKVKIQDDSVDIVEQQILDELLS